MARADTATDLKGLQGKRVALTDPASASGSVVPDVEFSSTVGQPLRQFFGSVAFFELTRQVTRCVTGSQGRCGICVQRAC